MGRQKNDGRGRLGGRAPGTPNKENPLKGYLKTHSLEYFKPRLQIQNDGTPRKIPIYADGKEVNVMILADTKGKPLEMSDFDVDMMQLECAERVHAELRLLEFHTPKMKAVDIDMNVSGTVSSIVQKLKTLYEEEEN